MPTRYVVTQGECIASIAFTHGFFPETLWNAPENAQLRKSREDPYVLSAGDVVHIPDLRQKEVQAAPEKVHRFRRKGVPEKLRLTFALGEAPRANTPYALEVDGEILSTQCTTDANGCLEHYIPPNARRAIVRFSADEEYVFDLRCLEPLDSAKGVAGRLRSLGYYGGPLTVEDDDATLHDAIVEFQLDHGLDPSGTPDAATSDALQHAYAG